MKLKIKKKKLVRIIWIILVIIATTGLLASSMAPAITAIFGK